MLGSYVPVNNPRNPLLVTRLQNRNMRVTVSNQKADVMFELYNPNQPIEQFNANLTVPVKHIHETEYKELDKWTKETKSVHESDSLNVKTLTNGNVNYHTGIPKNRR